MDLQTLLNLVLGIFCTVFGWFAREMWAAVKDLKSDLATLRVEIAKEYIPKTDFNIFKDELFTTLRRIEDKLERKSDK